MLLGRDQIQTAPQPRTQFDADKLEGLAQSIREQRANGAGIEGTGILQPLIVTALEGNLFQLVAGERRLRASELAGLSQLPCIVVGSEGATVWAQLIENLQRQDLMPIEEARALGELIKEGNLSIRDASQKLGKDRGWVQNRVKLLKCAPDILQMVEQRSDSLPHAFEIEVVQDAQQRQRLITATLEGVSVAELRRRIAAFTAPQLETGGTQVSFQNDTLSRQNAVELVFGPLLLAAEASIEKLSHAVLTQDDREKAHSHIEIFREKIKDLETILKK